MNLHYVTTLIAGDMTSTCNRAVTPANATSALGEVTCGNCKRSRVFKDAMEAYTARISDAVAAQYAQSCGFGEGDQIVTASGERVNVVTVNRHGISVINADDSLRMRSFPNLAAFLDWAAGDLDLATILGYVKEENGTLDQGITYAVALRGDVDHETSVESALAAQVTERFSLAKVVRDYRPVAEDAMTVPAPFRTARKVKSTSASRKYRKGA